MLLWFNKSCAAGKVIQNETEPPQVKTKDEKTD